MSTETACFILLLWVYWYEILEVALRYLLSHVVHEHVICNVLECKRTASLWCFTTHPLCVDFNCRGTRVSEPTTSTLARLKCFLFCLLCKGIRSVWTLLLSGECNACKNVCSVKYKDHLYTLTLHLGDFHGFINSRAMASCFLLMKRARRGCIVGSNERRPVRWCCVQHWSWSGPEWNTSCLNRPEGFSSK